MTWTTRQRCKFAGLAAIEAGIGPDVLLLHGVGLRSEAWNMQIDALATHYHVIAPDMPGHGQSPCIFNPMTLTHYTDAVVAGVDGPALIAGHSMGAMIALDMAIRYSHKVRGVVAVNAIFERSRKASNAVKARAARLDGVSAADPAAPLDRWFGNELSPERTACHDWLTNMDPAGYKMAYTAFAQSDGPNREDLANLPCPALFITGSNEPNSTPQMSLSMATLAPRGRAMVIEGAAHMMPMTHASAVNAALGEFAQEVWR